MSENKVIVKNENQFANLLSKIKDGKLEIDSEIVISGSDYKPSAKGIEELMEILEGYTYLSSISLEIRDIDIQVTGMMKRIVNGKNGLKALKLTKNDLRDKGVKDLLPEDTSENSNLVILVVRNNRITVKGIEVIAKLKNLEALDLGHNTSIDNNEGGTIVKILKNKDLYLKELIIDKTNIKSEGIRLIAEALVDSPYLEILELSKNEIGDDGAEHIANALKDEELDLKNLILRDCSIGNRGTKRIAEALKHNKSLKRLNLSWNFQIDDEGIKALAESLEDNESLTHLNLRGIEIGEEGAKALLKMLQKNTSITSLEYSRNANIPARVKHDIQHQLDNNNIIKSPVIKQMLRKKRENFKAAKNQEYRLEELRKKDPKAEEYYNYILGNLKGLHLAANLNKNKFFSANMPGKANDHENLDFTRHMLTAINGIIPIPGVGVLNGCLGMVGAIDKKYSKSNAKKQLERVSKWFGTSLEDMDSIFEQVAIELTEKLLGEGLDDNEVEKHLKKYVNSMTKAITRIEDNELSNFISDDRYENNNQKKKYLFDVLTYAATANEFKHTSFKDYEKTLTLEQIDNTGKKVTGTKNTERKAKKRQLPRLLKRRRKKVVEVEERWSDISQDLFDDITIPKHLEENKIQNSLEAAVHEKALNCTAFKVVFSDEDNYDKVLTALTKALEETLLTKPKKFGKREAEDVVKNLAVTLLGTQNQQHSRSLK